MAIELTMLGYATGLLIVLVLIQAVAGVRGQGLMPLANSRDGLAQPAGFHARALRVVNNHREGLTIFAPLALIAVLAHHTNSTTAMGAQLFAVSRAAHAALYLLGVPVIRPLVWGVGLAGTVMVGLGAMGLA